MNGQGDPPNTKHRVEGARCFIHGRHTAIHLCCPARAASIILPSQAILGLGSAFLPHHPGPSPLLGWGHSSWLEVKARSHTSTTTEHSGKLRFPADGGCSSHFRRGEGPGGPQVVDNVPDHTGRQDCQEAGAVPTCHWAEDGQGPPVPTLGSLPAPVLCVFPAPRTPDPPCFPQLHRRVYLLSPCGVLPPHHLMCSPLSAQSRAWHTVGALQILLNQWLPVLCSLTSAPPKPIYCQSSLFYDTHWAPAECQDLCKGLGAQWWQNNGPVLMELTFKLGINKYWGDIVHCKEKGRREGLTLLGGRNCRLTSSGLGRPPRAGHG